MERVAYSLRALALRYGVSRNRWAAAVRAGELPAARLGRARLLVLERDAEAWLARYRVRPRSDATDVVEAVLAREGRRAGSGP